VRPAEWWAERVAAYFSEALLVPWPDKAVCVITTWRPNAEALRACQNAIKAQATKRKFTRRWDRLSNRVRLFLNPPETRAGLLASLDGKRVAIVGNALSLAERTFGAEIESHDLVVRFNGACLPHRRSHGVRADWIATGISFDPAIAEAQNARTILWMSPNHKNLPPWMTMRRTGHFYLHARSDHQDLARRIGSSRPTTGAMMIDLALRNPNVKTVSLYGFDFFATPSFSGHHTAETAPHEFNREKAFIEALAARDPRLSLRALGSG
jgi:hypothetical protein